MSCDFSLAILSDVHYACAAEQAAGDDYEIRALSNPLLRLLLRIYRHYVWLRHPLRQNGQLDRFLTAVGPVDYAIANGDYCANVAAFGLCDVAALQSAQECLDKLRRRFGEKLLVNFGDHELGKLRLLGSRGGLRLESWRRATAQLGLRPFWRLNLGNYVLMNVVSTLAALPVFEHNILPEERPAWEKLREAHFAEIRTAFAALQPEQRVLLFCHDPTALPFLWREVFCPPGQSGNQEGRNLEIRKSGNPDSVPVFLSSKCSRGALGEGQIDLRSKLPQIEQTIIGHLHSNLFLHLSRLLSGMPVIRCLGSSVRKFSTALNEARLWRPFRVRLCPSLAGIELLKDGGYFTVKLDAEARRPAEFVFHPLPR